MKLRIQHALAKPVPTIPKTPQTDLTRLRNQHDTHMDTQMETQTQASILYIRTRIFWHAVPKRLALAVGF